MEKDENCKHEHTAEQFIKTINGKLLYLIICDDCWRLLSARELNYGILDKD